jgi:RNA polymerase sigma factor (sigma-70 family)
MHEQERHARGDSVMKSEAVVRQFQRLLEPGTVAGLTECQVLERFAERGDPVAFEAIVARHGPMVFTVCRQLLRDPNDVDDAFQGTFLIFIKKAGTLRQPDQLGPWLYGVAYRVALRARKRRRKQELPEDLAGPRIAFPAEDNEQLEALHCEIQRLPEKYRVPIVLCCIEGLSHDEAARRLDWPVGTVHGRLSRARELLRNRFSRRGGIAFAALPDVLDLLHASRSVLPEGPRRAVFAASYRRKLIEREMGFLESINESDRHGMSAEQVENQERTLLSTSERLKKHKDEYVNKRVQLALLKRRIALDAKTVKTSDQRGPSATEIVRKLDRLEEKIDQMIKSLPTKTDP